MSTDTSADRPDEVMKEAGNELPIVLQAFIEGKEYKYELPAKIALRSSHVKTWMDNIGEGDERVVPVVIPNPDITHEILHLVLSAWCNYEDDDKFDHKNKIAHTPRVAQGEGVGIDCPEDRTFDAEFQRLTDDPMNPIILVTLANHVLGHEALETLLCSYISDALSACFMDEDGKEIKDTKRVQARIREKYILPDDMTEADIRAFEDEHGWVKELKAHER